MKFAVSSYSFGQYTWSGRLTTFGCIEKAKEMGFDAIEFTEFEGPDGETPIEYAAKLRAEADRVGIELSLIHI